MKQKILIIKSGYSEFLFNNSSDKPSFGDILRITPILHLFKEDYVIWATDKSAFPLLEGNPYIAELLPLDFTTAVRLLEDDFDVIINLEKNHSICKLVNMLDAWKKYGFRFDKRTNKAEAFDKASEVLAYSADSKTKRDSKKSSQELLFELVGEKWNGEEYVLGYKPKTREIYDVALNTKVGLKFPFKAWPSKHWDILEKMLSKKGFTVTRQDKQPQEVLTNLYRYMDWLNSSRLIVTNDSLGLHLAFALKKQTIGLFGPTKAGEVEFYGRGKAILPEPHLDCVPCLNEEGECLTKKHCMKKISPKRIFKEIVSLRRER